MVFVLCILSQSNHDMLAHMYDLQIWKYKKWQKLYPTTFNFRQLQCRGWKTAIFFLLERWGHNGTIKLIAIWRHTNMAIKVHNKILFPIFLKYFVLKWPNISNNCMYGSNFSLCALTSVTGRLVTSYLFVLRGKSRFSCRETFDTSSFLAWK